MKNWIIPAVLVAAAGVAAFMTDIPMYTKAIIVAVAVYGVYLFGQKESD